MKKILNIVAITVVALQAQTLQAQTLRAPTKKTLRDSTEKYYARLAKS